MKCMSCLGLVVRLNSFRGFNLAHINKAVNWEVSKLIQPLKVISPVLLSCEWEECAVNP